MDKKGTKIRSKINAYCRKDSLKTSTTTKITKKHPCRPFFTPNKYCSRNNSRITTSNQKLNPKWENTATQNKSKYGGKKYKAGINSKRTSRMGLTACEVQKEGLNRIKIDDATSSTQNNSFHFSKISEGFKRSGRTFNYTNNQILDSHYTPNKTLLSLSQNNNEHIMRLKVNCKLQDIYHRILRNQVISGYVSIFLGQVIMQLKHNIKTCKFRDQQLWRIFKEDSWKVLRSCSNEEFKEFLNCNAHNQNITKSKINKDIHTKAKPSQEYHYVWRQCAMKPVDQNQGALNRMMGKLNQYLKAFKWKPKIY